MDKVNLDDIRSAKQTAQGSETTLTPAETGLVFVGSEKSDKKQTPPESRSIHNIYDEFQKLLYLIDISDSMRDVVVGAGSVDLYIWSEFSMQQIAMKVSAAVEAVKKAEDAAAAILSSSQDEDPEMIDMPEVDQITIAWAKLEGKVGDDLKLGVIQFGLTSDASLRIDRNYSKMDDSITKLGLVKKMARKMVDERYQKYPRADVHCLTFNTAVHVVSANNRQQLLDGIDKIAPAGGTWIYAALESTLEMCKKAPSAVGLHHIVLVTDGEDGSGALVPELLPQMKELGVVLDFIYIKQHGDEYTQANAAIIKSVCDATGGTYKEVNNAKEFETQFIAASTKLLAPPSSKPSK